MTENILLIIAYITAIIAGILIFGSAKKKK